MMYGYGWGHGLGFGLFGGIISLIFWVFIIWLIVSLIRSATGHHGRHCWWGDCRGEHGDGNEMNSPRRDAAMDVLRERYAKGEISKEEFEEKSQVLGFKK